MTTKPTTVKIASEARRILAREGADAVTMRRVAQAIGITPMALYRHYPNRAGLLNALADEGFDALATQLAGQRYAGDCRQRLFRFLDVYLDFALENPRLFELMFLEPREGARRYPRDFRSGASPTASIAASIIRNGMASGELRSGDPWEIVFEMGALLQGLIMLHLGGRTSLSAARFRSLCRRSFRRYFDGIRN